MKEQTQQPGVRKWAGDDMVALQAEPLSAIQGFFKEYGNCIIQGCAVVPAAGGKFDIAPGLLGLSGTDADGVATFKVVPFSGVENVTLPLYFTLTHSVVDRVYGDGKVKPIAYDYRAAVSAVKPAAGVEFLELTTAGGRRFVDAVKITEKLDKVGNGKDVTVTFSQAASRVNIASGEKLTTILGKIVRWLADLKALAFKDKVGKGDMDAALQGELDGKEPGFAKNTAFNKNFGAVAGTVCQGNDVRLSDARPAKGGNADMVGGLRANMFARAYIPVSFGGTGGDIITEEFITILNNHGAFNQPFWSSRGTWFFAGNKIISDTGVGRIHLAGASVEVISDASTAMFTARITTAATTPDAEPRRVFVYTKNDTSAAWSKLANSTDIPTSLPANGGNADTVDGKHATDFVSKTDKAIVFMGEATGNIDTITKPGVYGINTDHRPVVGSPFSYGTLVVMNAESAGNGGNPIVQVFYSATGSVLSRIKWLNSWTALKSVSDGGNAETVDGKHAGDFHLKNDNINIQYSDLLGGRWIEQKILDYKTVGLHFNRSVAAGVWSQLDIYTRGSDGYQKRMDVSESGGIIQGNLTLNTQNSSYVVLKRNNAEVGYMGLGNTAKKDLILQLYGFGNLRIGEDGKNYSNSKEIATVDQIKSLSGGAAPTAGQYVSGITVNDHAITVTKAALPTGDRGGVGSRDWNTILEPGSYNTSPQSWGANTPAGVYQYGLLTVECSGDSIVQTYCESNYATMCYRLKSTGSPFSAWTQVAKKSDIPTTTAQLTDTTDKRFMSDAQEAKLDGSLEVAFAGIVDKDGVKLKSKGRQFNVQKNGYGLFTVNHNENDANLIVQVMSEGGTVSVAHTFTTWTFKVDSYAGAGGDTNGRGFRFVAYKL